MKSLATSIGTLALLTLLFTSCKKVNSVGQSESITFGENVSYTLNPQGEATVKTFVLSETDFVSSIRGKIETEQEALNRDIYDFEIRSVEFTSAFTNNNSQAEIDLNDPLDNYLNRFDLFFDKNNGSDPIKIGTSQSVNTGMIVLQSDLHELTSKYPEYKILFRVIFDQVPNELRSAQMNSSFTVSTAYKYKAKT
jgi:hypothetical protein